MNAEPTNLPDRKKGTARAYALPPAADLAARIIDGETTDQVAATLHITTIALVRRLNKSGYSATGEIINAKRPAKDIAAFEFRAQEWMNDGACTTIGGDLWFSSEPGDRALAVAICQECPVQTKCLAFALETDAVTDGSPEGVWGGLTGRERHRLAKKTSAA